MDSDEVQALQERLEIHLQNLRHLENRKAKYTALEAPIHLLHQIDDERAAIADIKGRLKSIERERKARVRSWGEDRLHWVDIVVILGVLVIAFLFVRNTKQLPGYLPPSPPKIEKETDHATSVPDTDLPGLKLGLNVFKPEQFWIAVSYRVRFLTQFTADVLTFLIAMVVSMVFLSLLRWVASLFSPWISGGRGFLLPT